MLRYVKKVIQNHLSDLADKNYEIIASQLGIESDAVIAIESFIKENFTPSPGSQFSKVENHIYMTPSFDIQIKKKNGLFIKNLEKENGIQFTLSKNISKMLNDPSTG